ncbi:MAG: WYL domain-containing protein [Hyphomonadaceae bacterium]|nr:MAG: DeoR family transcriptional regulator [Caulobacteraceae bacterium]MBT9444215.1 WYL domain-containing protein [Hyphomonadaceae bacterium]TPW06525.1 MAG: DeoR family transcriptional regulator [Alphaproteobacteria bacterium]
MRASRLLSILILLQMRGRLSAEALAQEFEVSVRTVYRDIDQLSAAGVPVYAERGRSGGFALLDGYRTRLTGFTPAEADALLLAGVGGAAADLGMGADLAAAQLKLLASLPPDSGASAQRVASRFHLDPANWYSRVEPLEMLPALAAAVWSDTRIRIRYESWKDVVMREVDPLGLVLKGGVWYLVAAMKAQPRTYRVSNIQGLDVLDIRFKRPARFDLARYWSAWAKDFEARLLRERATVKLSPEGLRLLRELSPAAGEAVDAAHRKCAPSGWIRADIPVESVDYASRQLLRLGGEIEVLGPPALREAVAEEARRVVDLYGVKAGKASRRRTQA